MSGLPHDELFDLDPHIERTFRQRRRAQKASQASTSSMMADKNILALEGPPPLGSPPNGRNDHLSLRHRFLYHL